MAETEPDCRKLSTNAARIKQLSSDAATKAANAEEINRLTAEIDTLSAKPLSRLCSGFDVEEENPRTCNFLASQVSMHVVSVKDTASATPEAKAKAELDKEQFAAKVAIAKQPDRQTSNNKGGSSAQIDPVESIQPITLAGGSVALSGTRSGTKGVGTITINPLALSRPDSVITGRLFDVSVSAPFDLNGGTSEDRRYVSARLRVNATAPISAAALQAAVTSWLNAEGTYADSLEAVLQSAPNLPGCVTSILSTQTVTKAACGQELGADGVRSARAAAFAQIARAQREADAYYVGIDARLDVGDPTGADVVGDKGTHILGGIAAGLRIAQGSRFDWELRGRAAADYFKSRDAAAGPDPKPVYSFDWGAAFILSGRVQEEDKQRLALGVGVEGRHAGDSAQADLAPTNYANLNLMAIVPAVSGGDLGLGISIPVAERSVPRGMMVSLSTDLGLLDRSGK